MENRKITLEDLENFFNKPNKGKVSTQYDYGHVDIEYVMENPEEYIIPQCLPTCISLWDKNIETFMVSNKSDLMKDAKELYVLLSDLSDENINIIKQLMLVDKRYFFDEFRNAYGFNVDYINDEESSKELYSLSQVFKIQDTLKYKTEEQYLKDFAKIQIAPDGSIHSSSNDSIVGMNIDDVLKQTGEEHLYVPEEKRIYKNPLYLSWHMKYKQYLRNSMNQDESSFGTQQGGKKLG